MHLNLKLEVSVVFPFAQAKGIVYQAHTPVLLSTAKAPCALCATFLAWQLLQ